jgi:uncharacterized protein YukE
MSNRQVIVNPDELKNFAQNLKVFNENLTNNSKKLHGQFKRLGESWRDQEHEKFKREFEQAMKTIQKFMEASNQYILFLKRKAEIAQNYLDQH